MAIDSYDGIVEKRSRGTSQSLLSIYEGQTARGMNPLECPLGSRNLTVQEIHLSNTSLV